MPSSYSPDLRLELPADGEQTGLWGQTTNRNLGTLVESAIAGSTTVSVTMANQALTALNGADDQARHAMLVLTTTTTAAFAVYAPPASKTYIVRNASAYAATVYNSTTLGDTTAAGAGVAVPAGKTLLVFSDGTNVRTIDAAELTGTLAVANGGTGVTEATGTEKVVLSASPELTGTPTAPTAATDTNNTQLATTAFVRTALRALYPVGSIYINAGVDTNPATLLGFGTWTAFGAGKVLVGQDTGDAAFDTLEETGGSKDAVVVAHAHEISVTAGSTALAGSWKQSKPNPDPTGVFSTTASGLAGAADGSQSSGFQVTMNAAHTHDVTGSADSTGVSGTNANLQPYVVVKMWKRTA